jgi:hypothetical protein
MKLKDVTLHILPGLAFDVIIGFPCIRKCNLIETFSYLFSESHLQVHNCTMCRQYLPKVFQQESSPSDGETHSKVLLAVLCASALNLLREPCGVPGGSVVEARRSGCPGGHASVPQGLICDRKASDLAPTQLPWTASTADGVRRSGCPGGHALVPKRPICDRKASDLAPALSGTTGSAECGLHVMVRQARNEQYEYLNAQRGALEDESSDEFWSNPHGGRDLVEMSDLVPLRCDVKTTKIDIEKTLI